MYNPLKIWTCDLDTSTVWLVHLYAVDDKPSKDSFFCIAGRTWKDWRRFVRQDIVIIKDYSDLPLFSSHSDLVQWHAADCSLSEFCSFPEAHHSSAPLAHVLPRALTLITRLYVFLVTHTERWVNIKAIHTLAFSGPQEQSFWGSAGAETFFFFGSRVWKILVKA